MLKVKQGREYVSGGKMYRAGDVVDGVPDKFLPFLTSVRGPLERADASIPADLPKEAFKAAAATETKALVADAEPDEAALAEDAPAVPLDDEAPKRRTYKRRDLTAED